MAQHLRMQGDCPPRTAITPRTHYHSLPIRNALRMTARLSPMSPIPTASHRVMIPGKASTAKDPLIRIAAITFSLTTDIVFCEDRNTA